MHVRLLRPSAMAMRRSLSTAATKLVRSCASNPRAASPVSSPTAHTADAAGDESGRKRHHDHHLRQPEEAQRVDAADDAGLLRLPPGGGEPQRRGRRSRDRRGQILLCWRRPEQRDEADAAEQPGHLPEGQQPEGLPDRHRLPKADRRRGQRPRARRRSDDGDTDGCVASPASSRCPLRRPTSAA